MGGGRTPPCPDSIADLRKRFHLVDTTAMMADYLTKKLPSSILRDLLKRGTISIAEYAPFSCCAYARVRQQEAK